MTSTFLALKTGQELEDSWPAHLIASKTTRHWSIPSVRFLRTRFFNYTEGTDHRNELHEMILKKDLLVNQIVLSPFSSLSWALINSCHRTLTLDRPSIISRHLGFGKTALEAEKVARIEGTKQLVQEVRARCVTCRKQLQRTCKDKYMKRCCNPQVATMIS